MLLLYDQYCYFYLYLFNMLYVYNMVYVCFANLKPQDSFGRFVQTNSRSSESGPYHHKASLNPPAIVLNDML